MKNAITILCALALLVWPRAAMAWGYTGHRIINLVAVQELPEDVPAFLRTPSAAASIEALGPEMDQLKGAGFSWDHDDDPGHYVDIGDDGKVAGVVSMLALPDDMEAYGNALAGVRSNPYKAGYLPYAIADGWEQVRKDFAYWRVYDYLARSGPAADRAAYAAARTLREELTVRDIGVWGHFVGDGSQPLHATTHYNDGGLHARFEGAFVRDYVTADAVEKLVPSGGPRSGDRLLSQRDLLGQIGEYLTSTNQEVQPTYAIEKKSGYKKATPEAIAFATARVADGARELRDLIVQAYDNSTYESVGYPTIPVQTILDGKIAPTLKSFGGD